MANNILLLYALDNYNFNYIILELKFFYFRKLYSKDVANKILRDSDVSFSIVLLVYILEHLVLLFNDKFNHISMKVILSAFSSRHISIIQSDALVIVNSVFSNYRLRVHRNQNSFSI
jgi:hypothetical protein